MRHAISWVAIGVFATAGWVLAFADVTKDEADKSSVQYQDYRGRYVLKQLSEFRKDQYMVDTETGRIWQIQIRSDSEVVILVPIRYRLADDNESLSPGNFVEPFAGYWDVLDKLRNPVAPPWERVLRPKEDGLDQLLNEKEDGAAIESPSASKDDS